MSSPLKLTIMTRARGEPTGYDSAIIGVPEGWYVTMKSDRAFNARLAGRDLRRLSEHFAANLGEKLHHAEWTITSDPAEVKTLGLMHDCPTCRAGVDQAVTRLRDHPADEMAVGQLWWASDS